jgi:hypothetical protein
MNFVGARHGYNANMEHRSSYSAGKKQQRGRTSPLRGGECQQLSRSSPPRATQASQRAGHHETTSANDINISELVCPVCILRHRILLSI